MRVLLVSTSKIPGILRPNAQLGSQLGLGPLTRGRSPLCQYPLHHFAMHVGQPHVAAAEAVGQPLVVDAEQVQHRGVQVVDLDLVLDGVVAVLVGRAVDRARP